MGCAQSNDREKGLDHYAKLKLIKIELRNSIPVIKNLKNIAQVKKAKIKINDANKILCFEMAEKFKGLAFSEGGLIKLSLANYVFSKASFLQKYNEEKYLFTDVLYLKKIQKFFAIRKEEEGSSLYKISIDGEFYRYPIDVGEVGTFSKLSKDPFEEYLSVRLDDLSFIVFSNLDSESLKPLYPAKKMSGKRCPKILDLKLFEYKKLAVFSTTGTLFLYDLSGAKKMKLLHYQTVDLAKNEIPDAFDIFLTGEVFCVTTKLLDPIEKLGRILIIKNTSKTQEPKKSGPQPDLELLEQKKGVWEFDFNSTENEDKYTSYQTILEEGEKDLHVIGETETEDQGRKVEVGFSKIYIDFFYNRQPVFFGFQKGKHCSLLVAKMGEGVVEKVCYLKEFMKGNYVHSTVCGAGIYAMDDQMNVKMLILGTMKKRK